MRPRAAGRRQPVGRSGPHHHPGRRSAHRSPVLGARAGGRVGGEAGRPRRAVPNERESPVPHDQRHVPRQGAGERTRAVPGLQKKTSEGACASRADRENGGQVICKHLSTVKKLSKSQNS